MVVRKSKGPKTTFKLKAEQAGWTAITILGSGLFVASAAVHGTAVPESIANVVTEGSGILSLISLAQVISLKRSAKEPSEWKD